MSSVLVNVGFGVRVNLKEPTPPPLWLHTEVGKEEIRKAVKDIKRHLSPFWTSF